VAFNWSTGSTAAAIGIAATGIYWVEVANALCKSADSVLVHTVQSPVWLGNDTVVCTPMLLLETQSGYTYSWQDGSTASTLTVTSSGVYAVTVTTPEGCLFADQIYVNEHCEDLIFPTAFSPNGDGINDGFGPVLYNQATAYELHVYNRWGQRVFSSDRVDAEWDGMFKGKDCELGVYVWYTRYKVVQNSMEVTRQQHGNVTLMR
jgi:gliding motility-associated-like protein